MSFLDTAKGLTGVGGSGISVTMIITILVLIILVALIGGAVAWALVNHFQWNKKVKCFEKVMGRLQITRLDKARIIRIGNSGDEVLLIKKNRKILPRPVLQAEPKTYWYEIKEDGEWINIEPQSIDTGKVDKNGVMNMHYLDKEMRYARGALGYMNKERYDEATFMQKYGGLIAYGVLILVTCIGLWLILDRLIEVAVAQAGAMDSVKEVLSETGRILGAVDNVQQGGGGLRPA